MPPTSQWLAWSVGLLVIALLIFALPSSIEGPVLVRLGPGHAITVVDALAIVPLLIASLLLYAGLWRARSPLREFVRRHPGRAVAGSFTGGAGLGLLLASVFSAFFWWWAIGATLIVVAVLAACFLAARSSRAAA
jgi:hypothetical protein